MVKCLSTARNIQEHPDIHRVIYGREEGRGWWQWPGEEKRQSKGDRAIKPEIKSLSENGHWRWESQRYKIDNKYQKAKIKNLEWRLDSQKYNIKNTKKNRSPKLKKYIYGICFRKIVFFRKVGYKNERTEIFKKLEVIMVKIYISKNFSGAVVGSVGSVQCQIVPCSSLHLFSKSIAAPSNARSQH